MTKKQINDAIYSALSTVGNSDNIKTILSKYISDEKLKSSQNPTADISSAVLGLTVQITTDILQQVLTELLVSDSSDNQ